MTGLVRKATLLAICGLLAASAAMAGVPNAATSTINGNLAGNKHIQLVPRDNTGNVADPNGSFKITVRDLANNVVANATVEIRFVGCPSARAARTADQGVGGATVNTAAKTVRVLTNASGVADFRIVGGSCALGDDPDDGACAEIVLDPAGAAASMGNIRVAEYDLTGLAGMDGLDSSRLAADYFNPSPQQTYQSAIDYNGDGVITGGLDIALFSQVFFRAGGTSSGTYTDGATWGCAP